jgi:filamentous hemagglutinin family protein
MTLFNQKLNRHLTNKQSNKQLIKPALIKRNKMLCLFRRLSLSLVCGAVALIPVEVVAQVTPDGSVPTTVEEIEEIMRVNGGEREGNNLFHSFEEFSIPEGMEAVFENALDIENIFARITGESASAIDGILSSQGSANFFLINPNGIIFGENASLDVGGSFIATTADSVEFEDGAEFSADPTQDKPIVKISVPIGLQFEGDNGAITVNGNGSQITPADAIPPISSTSVQNNTTELLVDSGETLALIGGDVNLNGGVIKAPEGRIQLGSIGSGSVSFQETEGGLTFGYENTTGYQNIALTKQALIDTSGQGQGAISLTGNNISLSDGSYLLDQNQGDINSETISLNANESLTLSGTSPDGNISSVISSETIGNGKGADITISTPNLLLKDGASIATGTYSNAPGGNVTINAPNSVQLLENNFVNPNRENFIISSIGAATYDSGNAGFVKLSTQQLKLVDGAVLSSSTFGTGDGGILKINADLVEVSGIRQDRLSQSTITVTSVGTGNAGNLFLDVSKLQLKDGGSVNSSSVSNGNAGSLTIDASESIEVSGESSQLPSGISSSVSTLNELSRMLYGLPEVPRGDAGEVKISTPRLNVNSGGIVSARNTGIGNAGTLTINAEDINLDNAGIINTTAASGIGGNINLDTDNLQIDEGSQITAEAGNNGDGGNITINTNTLIAKKNSEVTANAFNGTGGNLEINAEGLFLFDSLSNIFSASSELGIDGTIKINTPDLDLQKELEQSELKILTTKEAIASSCLARSNQQGSFTVNNSPGAPKSPDSNYSDTDFTLTGISSLPTTAKQPEAIESNYQPSNTSMLPASKMVETPDGRIFLVAAPQEPESLVCPQN